MPKKKRSKLSFQPEATHYTFNSLFPLHVILRVPSQYSKQIFVGEEKLCDEPKESLCRRLREKKINQRQTDLPGQCTNNKVLDQCPLSCSPPTIPPTQK